MSKKDSKDREPSETVYHIKQTVNVTPEGIKFNFYELDGKKKITFSGRKNPDGNYSIFEKIGDKVQVYESLTEEQFLKKIASIPHLKLINEQIANKMKKGLRRISLARTAAKKKSRAASKKRSRKASKGKVGGKRNSKKRASKKGSKRRSRN